MKNRRKRNLCLETGLLLLCATGVWAADDVTPRQSFRERYLKNVHGSIRVGSDLGFGTKDRQLYTAHFDATHAMNRLQNTVTFNAAYGKTDQELSANRMEGELKTTWDLGTGKKLYIYNNAGAGYDEIRKIDLGYQEGAGLGYKFLSRTNLVSSVEVGGQYHKYEYLGGGSKENLSVGLGQELTWSITPNVIFKEKAQFMPDVRELSDYRLRIEGNLSFPVWKSFTANLTVIDLYDSRPPTGVESNDLTVQFSLGYTF